MLSPARSACPHQREVTASSESLKMRDLGLHNVYAHQLFDVLSRWANAFSHVVVQDADEARGGRHELAPSRVAGPAMAWTRLVLNGIIC